MSQARTAYNPAAADTQQAGRELGVDVLLDGSFQRAGGRLRTTLQPIAVADGRSTQ